MQGLLIAVYHKKSGREQQPRHEQPRESAGGDAGDDKSRHEQQHFHILLRWGFCVRIFMLGAALGKHTHNARNEQRRRAQYYYSENDVRKRPCREKGRFRSAYL